MCVFFRLECFGKVSGCHAEQTHKHTDDLPRKTREGHRQSDEQWNRFKGDVGGTSERRWSAYGLFQAHRYHLELNWTELNKTCNLNMWLRKNTHCKLVHGCVVYIKRASRWQQFHMAPAVQRCEYTTLVDETQIWRTINWRMPSLI